MRPLFSHKFNKSLFNQNSKLTIGEVSFILKQTVVSWLHTFSNKILWGKYQLLVAWVKKWFVSKFLKHMQYSIANNVKIYSATKAHVKNFQAILNLNDEKVL